METLLSNCLWFCVVFCITYGMITNVDRFWRWLQATRHVTEIGSIARRLFTDLVDMTETDLRELSALCYWYSRWSVLITPEEKDKLNARARRFMARMPPEPKHTAPKEAKRGNP